MDFFVRAGGGEGGTVVPLIESKNAELAALCRQFECGAWRFFGSAATGDYAAARSDLDFLVEFGGGGPARILDAYFGLKEALEGLFGCPVDLVIPGAVRNPYVRAEMERSGELVYAA